MAITCVASGVVKLYLCATLVRRAPAVPGRYGRGATLLRVEQDSWQAEFAAETQNNRSIPKKDLSRRLDLQKVQKMNENEGFCLEKIMKICTKEQPPIAKTP